MQAVVSTITLFAVLWHTLLGCCGHHGHAACGTMQHSPAGASHGSCEHASGTTHAGHLHAQLPAPSESSDFAPAEPSPQPKCDQGRCAFQTAKATSGIQSPFEQPSLPLAIPNAVEHVFSHEQEVVRHSRGDSSLLPCCQHLPCTVLLI